MITANTLEDTITQDAVTPTEETLENIVERTDPELIKIFNITNSNKSAEIERYIQKKAIGKPERTLNK